MGGCTLSSTVHEYVRLFHTPTTSCILAFAVIGSVPAPIIYLDRLGWMLLFLFLGGGIAANYFDELQGRPWHTTISESRLWIIGCIALCASSLIGIYITVTWAPWFWLFVIVWGFITVAYDLELFHGFFHNTPFLALSWGLISLGSYYVQSRTITPYIVIVSLITSCIAGSGRDLYEIAKPVCKDHDFSNTTSRRAWDILRVLIGFINLFALIVLANRLLNS